MKYLKIKNWDKWQSYRKDRGQPPWIKIHRCVMRDAEWVSLGCQQRGQLVAMWLLAADRNGEIPADPQVVRKLCYMDSDPNLNYFISLGFIEGDASVASSRRQDDAPETETEAEKRREEKHLSQIPQAESDPEPGDRIQIPVSKIVDLYHQTLCPPLPIVMKLTKSRRGYIQQRWREDLPSLEHWENFFAFVKTSDFLMGRVQSGDRRPFVATLEWLTKPANFAKISEDRYHGKD